ncbi:unnamed protein product [Camellia sinensis]
MCKAYDQMKQVVKGGSNSGWGNFPRSILACNKERHVAVALIANANEEMLGIRREKDLQTGIHKLVKARSNNNSSN